MTSLTIVPGKALPSPRFRTMSLFLMEIAIVPGVYLDRFGKLPSWVQDLIIKNIRNKNALKFKVIGENKFIALAESEVIAEEVVGAVTKMAGPYVTIKSTPVRNLEEFAQNILKVNPEFCISRRDAFATTEKIFFTKITIDHPGSKLEDRLPIWKAVAEYGLTTRMVGGSDFRAFKVIAQRAIYVFWTTDIPGDMDDTVNCLPMASESDFHFNDIAQIIPF